MNTTWLPPKAHTTKSTKLSVRLNSPIFSTGKIIKPKNSCKSLLAVSISMTLTTIFSGNSFATTSYNGDPTQITSSTAISGNFAQLIGSQNLNGIVDFAPPPSALPLASNADTIINYSSGSVLDFVLSGYAFASPNNTTETALASENKSQISQGTINSAIFTGLAHITVENQGIDCNIASNNCTEASTQTTIDNKTLTTNNNFSTIVSGAQNPSPIGDINSGYSAILIKNGNFISKNPSTERAQSLALDEITNNTLTSNSNIISISRNDQQLNNITAGYSGIETNYGEIIGGASTTISSSVGGALSQTTGNSNKLNANNNSISINGNSNTFNNSYIGKNEIIITREDAKASPAIATSPSFQYASASANSFKNTIFRLNTFTSTNNTATIAGNDNYSNSITAGRNSFNITQKNITANTSSAYASASSYAQNQENLERSTLTSRENIISISGNRNSLGNLTSGYNEIKITNGNITASSASSASSTANVSASSIINLNNATLSANQNSININGSNNSFNNLVAGYSGISISNGAITSGSGAGTSVNDGSSLSINTSSATLSANNNSISLNGISTITGNIHTGYINFSINHDTVQKYNGDNGTITVNLNGTRAFANGNSLSISGEHTINNSSASIYGGYLEHTPNYKPLTYDVFTGNTLNYNNLIPISINELANFQTYNFTLNPAFANSTTSLITANHINLGSDLTNMSGGRPEVKSDIYVRYISAGPIIPNNSEFILMESLNLEGNGTGHKTDSIAQQGISLVYDVSTFIRGNQVIALVEGGPTIHPNPSPPGPEANPQLKALLAGNLAGLMLTTRGADNIADNMFNSINEQNKKRGLVPFLNISANHSRYETGSHINSDGGIITTGLSYQNEQWTTGAFIEYGRDNYKTFNEFKNFKDTRGSGHNRFTGLGFYSHYDFTNGWYLDGSLRGGRLHTNFSSEDIQHPDNGITAKYNVTGNYYSLHLTAGHTFQLTEKNKLDTSAKYLWSSTDGKKIQIAGEPIKFNKLNSHRLRLNAENTYQLNEEISFISGLAYEYEFDGKAKGTALGTYHIPEPSVKGSTGVATLGVRYQPQLVPNLTLDLKASGYFGKREGGSGLIHMSYAF